MHSKERNRQRRPPRTGGKSPGERIAKVMARAGLCSRRDAEAWIAEGRVTVNGKPLTSPAVNVGPQDEIQIDGLPLGSRQRTRLFLFHKPRGLVTTNKDPQGRLTIFDALRECHPEAPRLVSVGRLDINTEGLLLLTNDGGLARVLELPATGWLRRYRVRANGIIDQLSLDRLTSGLTLDGIRYAGIDAKLDRVQGANCWLTVGLREGKNREIKRVLVHLGLSVNRLIRISFGPFQLGDLPEGGLEEVRTRILRDQLGPSLLQEASADLDAPLELPHAAKQERPPAAARSPRPRNTEPQKPQGRPAPRPHKHVRVLRAEAENRNADGARQRIERGETADRKGRVVAVERRVAVVPKRKERARKAHPYHASKDRGAPRPRGGTR